jgi:hypothetical protein
MDFSYGFLKVSPGFWRHRLCGARVKPDRFCGKAEWWAILDLASSRLRPVDSLQPASALRDASMRPGFCPAKAQRSGTNKAIIGKVNFWAILDLNQ